MIKQLKYTIFEVSKILVPRDQIYFPRQRQIDRVSWNQNLANSLSGIL